MIDRQRPLFRLGQLLCTPAFLDTGINPLPLLARHLRGDWGDLDPVDQATNQAALHGGARLFSGYLVRPAGRPATAPQKVWIITEADRASTTVLLPSDY